MYLDFYGKCRETHHTWILCAAKENIARMCYATKHIQLEVFGEMISCFSWCALRKGMKGMKLFLSTMVLYGGHLHIHAVMVAPLIGLING